MLWQVILQTPTGSQQWVAGVVLWDRLTQERTVHSSRYEGKAISVSANSAERLVETLGMFLLDLNADHRFLHVELYVSIIANHRLSWLENPLSKEKDWKTICRHIISSKWSTMMENRSKKHTILYRMHKVCPQAFLYNSVTESEIDEKADTTDHKSRLLLAAKYARLKTWHFDNVLLEGTVLMSLVLYYIMYI